MDLDPVEIRVLGCLVEKQRTTPDTYPLTLNALRLACNQSTNRDPVLDLDENEVRDAAQRLGRRRLARLASGHTTRATKYRHLLDEALGVGPAELALLTVLMLRGPQTPGELKGRADRMHGFADLAAVDATLDALIERGLVERLERRPGQKEQRYRHLLGGGGDGDRLEPSTGHEPSSATPETTPDLAEVPHSDSLERRVAALEDYVRELRGMLDALRRELGD